MPVQLPNARTINEYAVITTTDFYDAQLPWLRVMFFPGQFYNSASAKLLSSAQRAPKPMGVEPSLIL